MLCFNMSILICITLYCEFLFYQSTPNRLSEQRSHYRVFLVVFHCHCLFFFFSIFVPLRSNISWNLQTANKYLLVNWLNEWNTQIPTEHLLWLTSLSGAASPYTYSMSEFPSQRQREILSNLLWKILNAIQSPLTQKKELYLSRDEGCTGDSARKRPVSFCVTQV